ncbi:MAG TPA: protein-disulfide reductase DsbD family protein [Phycisphaerae bacterium]|nr:thioredoxin family protein [Phycisphaerales bacterium]HRX83689.1 protein-disulfide reductase DsbD family protein [Phycisphaerae bacterium]
MHASVSAVAPGSPFDLAVEFKLPGESFLYWENPGERGAAPQVLWHLPEGFSAGPLRFPMPKRKQIDGKTVNYINGSPMLVSTVTPPENLEPGSTVKLAADVRWQTGGDNAQTGTEEVALALPVAAEPAPAGDDDAFLFRLMKRTHPVDTDRATDIWLGAETSKENVAAGDTFDLILDVKVKAGYHTQSNDPIGEFFVPTTVFPRLVQGFRYGTPQWPEPHIREDRNFGKISEFQGDFKVRVPVTVVGPTAAAEVTLSGLFAYQACNEQGQCHPPEAVEWAVTVNSQTVGEAAEAPVTAGGTGTPPPATAAATPAPTPAPVAGAESGTESGPSAGSPPSGLAAWGIWGAIIGGLLGGLILNIMPCVLPVISIKVLSFVQQAGDDPKRVFRLGLTFAAGIIASFLIIAAVILTLQATTKQTQSWGSLFQQPVFVVAMIVVMFVFALNLFGVFEILLPGAASGKLAEATEREGFGGAFMKGVLATLLATPCTAPFLAPAISFALAGSAVTVAIVFVAAGIGMAFPYVLLTARPGWMKFLPRPGTWMVTFKQFMGFLLIGTAVWLLWVLAALGGAEAVVWMTAFLAFVGLACWLFGKVEFTWSPSKKVLTYVTALLAFGLGGLFSYGMYSAAPPVDWVAYEPGLAQKLAAEGRTVYLDYTAAWCATCQVNKKVVFGNQAVLNKFASYNVVPLEADYTAYNPVLADDLKRFGRDAVPLNVIYPAGKPNDPIVLPVVLTPGRVLAALDTAGPSSPSPSPTATPQPAAP